MAGTVTIAPERTDVSPRIVKVTFTWTATAGGIVTSPTGLTTEVFTGTVMNLITDPAQAPETPPAVNYGITILDDDGVDVLNGAGANRHNVNTEQTAGFVAGTMPRAIKNTTLDFIVAAAGAGGQGVAILYIAE